MAGPRTPTWAKLTGSYRARLEVRAPPYTARLAYGRAIVPTQGLTPKDRCSRLFVVLSVRQAKLDDVEQCVDILAKLPDYFTADTHDQLRQSFPLHSAWVAATDDRILGFVLAERRYPSAAEITFAAVARAHRGTGIGTAIVNAALQALAHDGVRVVEVKTLDASAGYEPYVATRAFWEARGFCQVDCIDPLPGWQPGNPSAVYVAALGPTR